MRVSSPRVTAMIESITGGRKSFRPAVPRMTSARPVAIMIWSVPKRGMSRKPADKLPNRLPAVDQKKIVPEAWPILSDG
ncbi:MAG: hypothetical protein UY22_C0050G0009 [Candidatus Amesbacteria bacterium GW2011_GWC1_48_10]|uniref:Uncharacterized protein n=1 Tax=Candidatus Amesbacteria bacterium GW2011_GWC1_48_10 TaxID=1618365 RepID=A0A0G1U9I3_9BACT|nr:MAG: hypothetical protein UY22_C0050G0009 [Candidatus Amesbacteria bacterium GW2011_GWC1_48_10]